MAISSDWRYGWHRNVLHHSHISSIKFSASNAHFFESELNSEPGIKYNMHYNALFLYIDEKGKDYNNYHLPDALLQSPEGETVMACPTNQHLHLTESYRESSNNDGNENPTSNVLMVYMMSKPTDWNFLGKDGQLE